jgi:cobalt-zinc-cadmium resistance protein CzcA
LLTQLARHSANEARNERTAQVNNLFIERAPAASQEHAVTRAEEARALYTLRAFGLSGSNELMRQRGFSEPERAAALDTVGGRLAQDYRTRLGQLKAFAALEQERDNLARAAAEYRDQQGATPEFQSGLANLRAQESNGRVAELISGVRSDVAIKLYGDDLEVLKEKADEIVKSVQAVNGAEDVKAEATSGLPQLQIKAHREAIARYGLNVEDVNDLVEAIVAGKEAGQVYQGEQRFNLVVRLQEEAGRDVETIKNLLLTAPNGARVPLSQVAGISLVEGAAQISREDTRRRIEVELNVRGRDSGSFVTEAQNKIEREVKLPPGYYLKWGGTFENLQRASARLLIVVPIALVLIFVLLYMTFNSVKQALLIYTGIPFAVVGGIFALALRGRPFSISAGVGFIALFGVAVLNGVVMVSFINHLREEGKTVAEAVQEGALTQLRPVLMTALVASLGFIPMAIATSAGAEVQRPLATVVSGGLITSTLLTLLILPTLYGWFERDAA